MADDSAEYRKRLATLWDQVEGLVEEYKRVAAERDALLPVAEAARAWRTEMGGPTFPHGVVVATPEFDLMVAVDLWTEKTEAGP